MKITSVTYRTNRPTSASQYIHQHVELTASLAKGETPEKALEALKAKAKELLYPELVNLRARIARVAPTVSGRFIKAGTTDEQLAALYAEHTAEFEALIRGELAPAQFLAIIY